MEGRWGVRYESWVERQIREAIERGELDNLPGAGKPIAGLTDSDEDWWVKRFLQREQIEMPLPTSLALRKEIATLQQTLADVRTEDTVRAIVADLNERIRDTHRRRVDGPPVVLRPVNVEAVVAEWRRNRER